MFVLRLVLRLIRKTFHRVTRPRAGVPGARPGAHETSDAFAERVRAELCDDLPDEDLGQDLGDCLDQYHFGSKPRCEEVEYLELVQEAIDRIERGR
ncbi:MULTISPECIES: hypothetical protein [Streptomyces]|uniref:hypothetical protein n=1 Tax=Streptomyces TaxID=1883 RepID=UPI00163CF03C|nr:MULTISPECIES: hypothetical protein [Streptomyces]MBC2875922.1 hypothetical protein [Streptomyces sp. TYQ1024]UBI38295.1 hypothetical protein K7I03_18745 [Streptomyces mobaraensis]UKW30880.1 hypothetical protein MCU78_18700 [Streptomyces sp. TYQ1024]